MEAARALSLELRHVSKSFGGIRAVRDVNLEVEPGTIHALIGPNGAGKTTLINLVTGVVHPDEGTLLLDGMPSSWSPLHTSARGGLARSFQNPRPLGELTLEEHVLLGLTGYEGLGLLGLVGLGGETPGRSRDLTKQIHEILTFLGLEGLAHVPVHALPHGQRRLADLARALAVRPRLLLLDEPAAGLMSQEVLALAKVLGQLREDGLSILVVEHNMDFILNLADRVTVLDHGSVIARGTPADVVRDPAVISAYLGPRHAIA